jgi:hypothetical protein
MTYTDRNAPADNRRFYRIRRFTMGQWTGMVAGAFVLMFGLYLLFSFL